MKELIPHIGTTYRTIADLKARCIEGFSMGGWLERLLCAGLFQTHGEKTLRDSMLSGEDALGEPA